VPLYSVYTTFEGVEAIPLAGWNGLVKAGEEARYVSWLEFCRQRLPATLRKLRSGQDIRLAGYGDSITSLGGRDPEMLVIPNGMHRDNLGYFERYSADWKIAQAHPTDYGGQKVPHHRLGWNWQLKRTVEERWPVQVEYLNWGVPGTTSDAGERVIEDCAYLNGANPARLARLLEDRPDIVTVGFGMNDVGEQIDTRANIVAICNAIRGGGAEVIVIGPCRQNPSWNSRDPMLWKHTYEAVIAGAFEAGVAFVPTWELFGDGNEGATGLSRRSHCAASMGNHPGARELAAVGKLLSAIIP
jgi:lysophospholipase L1-like esterase